MSNEIKTWKGKNNKFEEFFNNIEGDEDKEKIFENFLLFQKFMQMNKQNKQEEIFKKVSSEEEIVKLEKPEKLEEKINHEDEIKFSEDKSIEKNENIKNQVENMVEIIDKDYEKVNNIENSVLMKNKLDKEPYIEHNHNQDNINQVETTELKLEISTKELKIHTKTNSSISKKNSLQSQNTITIIPPQPLNSFDDIPIKSANLNFIELLEKNLATGNIANDDTHKDEKDELESKTKRRINKQRFKKVINISKPGEVKKYKYYSDNFTNITDDKEKIKKASEQNSEAGGNLNILNIQQHISPKIEKNGNNKRKNLKTEKKIDLDNKSNKNEEKIKKKRDKSKNLEVAHIQNVHNNLAENKNEIAINTNSNSSKNQIGENSLRNLRNIFNSNKSKWAEANFQENEADGLNEGKNLQKKDSIPNENSKETLGAANNNFETDNYSKVSQNTNNNSKLNKSDNINININMNNLNSINNNSNINSNNLTNSKPASLQFNNPKANNFFTVGFKINPKSEQLKSKEIVDNHEEDIGITEFEEGSDFISENLPNSHQLKENAIIPINISDNNPNNYYLSPVSEKNKSSDIKFKDDKQILDEKLKALDKEVQKFKNENENLSKLKLEYEKLTMKLNTDIRAFNLKKENDLKEFEIWREEEFKKINKEKKLLEKNSQNKLVSKKEKDEIELLRCQILKLQEDHRMKENTNKLVIDKLKKQLEEANLKIAQLSGIKSTTAQSIIKPNNTSNLPNNSNSNLVNLKLNYNSNNLTPEEDKKYLKKRVDKSANKIKQKQIPIETNNKKSTDVNIKPVKVNKILVDQEEESEECFDLVLPAKYHDKKTSRVIKREQTSDGKIIQIYENEKREVIFPSGVRKEIHSDGYQAVFFTNKDIKQVTYFNSGFPQRKISLLFFRGSNCSNNFP
jgi:hypothetical protein